MSTVTASWYENRIGGVWLTFSDEPDTYYGYVTEYGKRVSVVHSIRRELRHGSYTHDKRGELISTEEFEV